MDLLTRTSLLVYKPLEIEVCFLNREGTSCQYSGKTGELTFDPCERNVARTPWLGREKALESHERPLVVKPPLQAEIPPWGSLTGHNVTLHSRKFGELLYCLCSFEQRAYKVTKSPYSIDANVNSTLVMRAKNVSHEILTKLVNKHPVSHNRRVHWKWNEQECSYLCVVQLCVPLSTIKCV